MPQPGPIPDTQEAIVRALASPRFYPHAPERIEHLQTHISHVFLAGPFVYKLKKALAFPFVDQSTAAHRRALCEAEVRLNRRFAAPVYLGTIPVTHSETGTLALDGAGAPVDYLVWMRRLPHDGLLAHRLEQADVGPHLVDTLARRLAEFHAAAPTGSAIARHAAPEVLRGVWRDTLRLAAPLVGGILATTTADVLASFGPAFLARHEALFRRRQERGRIRDAHGDLHAEHVCFVEQVIPAPGIEPLAPGLYLFDCLEFSEPLRCIDVASEVAFTAMDLERRGRPDLARRFVDAYVAASGDDDVRTLLPYYVCARALVRGAVDGLAAHEPEVEPADRVAAAARAGQAFDLALRHAFQAQPMVIACCGLSGTGKTTLAESLARSTGFLHLSSDALRKEALPGDAAAYGEGRYTAEARERVYAILCREVERALRTGRGVAADATFIRRRDRDQLAAAAHRQAMPHLFVECVADPALVRGRLEARRHTLSDATWRTFVEQRVARDPFAPDEAHVALSAAGDGAALRDRALAAAWAWRCRHEEVS